MASDIYAQNKCLTLADVILSLQTCAGMTPASVIDKEKDVNGDEKKGLEEAIYGLQIAARVRFQSDLLIAEVADTQTEIGAVMTDSCQQEALVIYGEKDAEGILTSVTSATLMSLTDENNWLTVSFNSDSLPVSVEFPDAARRKSATRMMRQT